jgi:hypothetical protein
MKQYAWENYHVLMGGKFVTGIRGFRYKVSQEKGPIYAEGSKPHAMGRGNKSYECEMKILQSELEAIILSGGGDPTEIPPFTVVHQYVSKRGLPIIVDVIEDVEFKEIEKAMDQGAQFMEITLGCVCLNIKYNVGMIPNQ